MMKGMIFAERYKLEDFIGQGGMSLVYRAVDIRTGHSVAVKILKSEYNSDKEFLERFQREAQAASLMSHHNLVNLLDVGVEGEYRYLVLEYVNGNTLKDIIRQKGRLTPQTVIQITIRIGIKTFECRQISKHFSINQSRKSVKFRKIIL